MAASKDSVAPFGRPNLELMVGRKMRLGKAANDNEMKWQMIMR